MAAVVLLGAAWLLSDAKAGSYLRNFLALALLLPLPLLASAKAVIISAPLLLLGGPWRTSLRLPIRIALLAAVGISLYVFAPLPSSTNSHIQRAEAGAGKPLVARLIWEQVSTDPASLLFGKGPAETVSRVAYLTLPTHEGEGSPLSVLGLAPSPITEGIDAQVKEASGADKSLAYSTSLNSGVSSAFGLVGDLGIAGGFAYLTILGSLLLALWRSPSSLAGAAAGALVMMFALGFEFDWWEQPPFTVFVGTMVAIALTDGRNADETTIPDGEDRELADPLAASFDDRPASRARV